MKFILWLACAISLAASWSAAQDATPTAKQATATTDTTASKTSSVDPQKEADIRRLMAVTGAIDLGMQMMSATNIKPLLEQSLPPGEYRPKLIDLFVEKFQTEGTAESLTRLLIPIYDRHFSDEDIKGLIVFYETPLGKKAISVLPQVLSDSQQAGKQWGGELGRRCMEEVLSEHPDLAKALEAAEKSAQDD